MTGARRTSTVTLLFADLEGSTRMLTELGARYADVLNDYRRLVVTAAQDQGGSLVDTTGDGLFLSFPTTSGAVEAALQSQRAMRGHAWPEERPVVARMAVHTGEAIIDGDHLVGLDVHRAARICAAGHGGQILVSASTYQLLGSQVPAGVVLRDLGEHRLKDLPQAEHLYQVHAPDLSSEFPPLRSLDNWPNNLPRQLTSFIGREEAVADALRLLPDSPLLTLIGPGGVGKTRLALEVAAQFMDEIPDGAWLVDLAAISDEALVAEAIATTLRIAEQPGIPVPTTLAHHLRERRMVVILDNCEHLLNRTADIADELLRACRSLRIIATSREPLAIGGESLLPVGSMVLTDTGDLADLESSEAVRLFIDRARAVQPGFALSERSAPAVAAICRQLDGIPLAIELAAARVKALPPEAIAERLDDRFRLLTGGSRMALPRHRTLRAAIDWSFDLLTEPERTLLLRLSVFAGTFDLAAVESICGYGEIDPLDVLDVLTRLIDRSLVFVEPGESEPRYRLLDMVHQYAEERLLEVDTSGDLRRRHRAYFIRWAEGMGIGLFAGPGGSIVEARMRRETENLRAALRSTDEDPGSAADELRLAASLWGFWSAAGLLEEGRGWLQRAVSRTDGERSTLRAEALTGLGILSTQVGDLAAAEAAHAEALAIHRDLGGRPGIAYASSNLANVALEQGDLDRARDLYLEAIATTEEIPDLRAAAFATLNLADLVARQGDTPEAIALVDRSIARFQDAGDIMAVALAYGRSATFSLHGGDTADARTRHNHALAIFEQVGDLRGVARTAMFLGDIAAIEGDLAEAERLYRESISRREAVADRGGIATACDRLARLRAPANPEGAARLLGYAEGQREGIGASLPPADAAERDQLLAALENKLGSGRLGALRAEGRRISLAAVVGDA